MLEERLHFKRVRLSEIIEAEWRKRNGSKSPTREGLQNLGNALRDENRNPGELAKRAIDDLNSSATEVDHIVIDAIRNIGEIEALRERFGNRFFLIALECQLSERWERVRTDYESRGETMTQFIADSERDRDQETAFGQQVQLAVDRADVLLINDQDTTLAALRIKLDAVVPLLTGDRPRYANPSEILMNLAYSAAHGSKCLKRQVGAVLVDAPPGKLGDIVGQGFNENPFNTHPCVEEPEYGADPGSSKPGRCYRDIVRFDAFVAQANGGVLCPRCGKPLLQPAPLPPWRCASCQVDLEKYFWPERAMSWCTAVHAEVAAILSAGTRARGTTLYTTTFPCFQCAEKIAQAGVKQIVFTEPYPDIKAARRLELAGVVTRRFEGVRSGRFDEIFAKARPYVSDQLSAT
jgi:cytidine deaminase